ncbi:MAG: hypothetical protein U1E23_06365 [Reyranellaceae bacterium]
MKRKGALNVLLVVASLVLCTAIAEAVVDYLDYSDDLGPAVRHLDTIALAPGVQRAWFFEAPPPLPNRRPVPEAWNELVHRVEASGITEGTRRADMFKAWNAKFVGDPCRNDYLCGAPGHLFVYDPPDGEPHPPFRFMPDATSPVGLVTNQYGFRGPPVPFARAPRTVRIAFIGASTTVGSHFQPYSYPEFVGFWLNLWAAARKLDLKFEVLNAGRESINSGDNVVILRDEVLPLRPDLVVYYEGANQFDLQTLVPEPLGYIPHHVLYEGEACPAQPVDPTNAPQQGLLERIARNSALGRRVLALMSARARPGGGGEVPRERRPTTVFPKSVDERDPAIATAPARAELPVNLGTILDDLDSIRRDAEQLGAQLVLASFIWLVKDGMVLDPIRHRSILDYLSQGYGRFSYRDMERLAAFQNRVFAKYARLNDLAFIDVARLMPFDPDLYIDAIHNSYAGERLRAWVFLQGLVPLVEAHLKSGAWPRALPPTVAPAPSFKPREITFDCRPPRPRP